MVAKTPQKQRNAAMVVLPTLNSNLLKETLNKVDKCIDRLQELQYTIVGGTKVVNGVKLSPQSTRTYLKTSLICKQETLRIKNGTNNKSPVGKFQTSSPGDWRKMSLPAMLLGETVNEILQASKVTRDIVEAIAQEEDPKTPETQQKFRKPDSQTVNSNVKARRKKEKWNKRSESDSSPSSLQRARSRIAFKIISPLKETEKVQVKGDGENSFRANRVSPKLKPWTKKTVLFPNPLFSRTMSPVIAKNDMINNIKKTKETPYKFLIKSPPTSASKSSVSPTRNDVNLSRKSPKGSNFPTRNGIKLGNKSPLASTSPTRNSDKKSPKLSTAAKLTRSLTPTRNGSNFARKPSLSPTRNDNLGKKSPKPSIYSTRVGKKTHKLSTAAKLRRSFSPSRLAMRLVSPMKSRKSVAKCDDDKKGMMLKQSRPVLVPKRFSLGRI